MRLRRWETVILGGSIVCGSLIGLFVYFSGPEVPVIGAVSDMGEKHDLRLQIPLEQTEDLRAQFKGDFQKRVGFDLRDLYEAWIDRIGANGIVSVVHEAYPNCHDEAHDFGKVIQARLQNIGQSLAACEGACNSGCMHGVFMEAFAPGNAKPEAERLGDWAVDEHMDVEMVVARAEDACRSDGTYPVGDCIHGVGHAFMFLSDYDIPEALAACDGLASYPKAYYCATGAYMELINHPPKGTLEGKTILEPCEGAPYPAACFRYRFAVAAPAYYKNGGKFGNLVNACMEMERKDRLGCFHGIGNAHGALVLTGKSRVDEVCGFGDADDQTTCIDGMMERLSRYYPAEARVACQNAHGSASAICSAAVERGFYDLEKSFDLYQR